MTDPYKVLGVSSNATDDQIKTAYRELAKKYHPDNYANNPLADLAQEKMQEINEAYDAVMSQRKAGHSGGGAYGNSAGQTPPSQFADIRVLINSRRWAEAQELLDGVANSARDAEWYFLRGTIYYNYGWLDDALKFFGQAHSMNPQNPEYTAAPHPWSVLIVPAVIFVLLCIVQIAVWAAVTAAVSKILGAVF